MKLWRLLLKEKDEEKKKGTRENNNVLCTMCMYADLSAAPDRISILELTE